MRNLNPSSLRVIAVNKKKKKNYDAFQCTIYNLRLNLNNLKLKDTNKFRVVHFKGVSFTLKYQEFQIIEFRVTHILFYF